MRDLRDIQDDEIAALKTRLEDALDDVARLHREKMDYFEEKIRLERELSVRPEAGATWKQVPLGQTSVGAKKARPGHNVTLWHRDCLDESCDYEITITLPPLPQESEQPK